MKHLVAQAGLVLPAFPDYWKMIVKCGARGSRLSIVQTNDALSFIASRVKGFKAELITLDTPGDRDLTTPIDRSAPDFFTKDLDDAIRNGRIDFAIHSAKDLPSPIPDDLDWFWLPLKEDPADCLIFRSQDQNKIIAGAKKRVFKIGVSSARRSEYSKSRFPKSKLLSIRGAIDSRLAQLIDGRYDIVLMALAAIRRLFPDWDGGPLAVGKDKVGVLPIPLDELPPPEGQGRLAVVYKKGDVRMNALRRVFIKAVRFTSAGIGNEDTMTFRAIRDIEEADIVLADELSGATRGDRNVEWIDVGKRCGAHKMRQEEITELICDEVRKGKRVVRLKGGDSGLFGRLSEEVDALRELDIPFLVCPGVSALTAATTPNGLLLTKRGVANGFAVSTPRSSGKITPQVFFMASRMAKEILKKFPPQLPYAMIWNACGPYEQVEIGLCGKPSINENSSAGLLVVGYVGDRFERNKILVTCSKTIMPKAICILEDRGMIPVEWPMISLRLRDGVQKSLQKAEEKYNALVLTSPVAVRMFFSAWKGDVRSLPEIWTSGAGTDAELLKYGLKSDIVPESDFSAEGLVDCLRNNVERVNGKRVLRLKSAKASSLVASSIRRLGAEVDEVVLYDNIPAVRENIELPATNSIFFASTSGVQSFISRYGQKALLNKQLYVIGEPTKNALPVRFQKKAQILPLATL